MIEKLKKIIPQNVTLKLLDLYHKWVLIKLQYRDYKRYILYSSMSKKKKNYSYYQICALLTKSYHSVEKGLSHSSIRLGFGKERINEILNLLEIYKQKNYSTDSIAYVSAVDNLLKYIKYHEGYNYNVSQLKEHLEKYPVTINCNTGGVYEFDKFSIQTKNMNFTDFSKSRHSIRTFSGEKVDVELIKKAIELAQNAPSSCNRQPWITRIIRSENYKKKLISNQSGNIGFGENVDTFIIVTSKVEGYNTYAERNQCYIDGGMYAMNLIYSLHYYELATCPLSAALTLSQEYNIRKEFNIPDSENLILIIAVGNYADKYKVPKSKRYNPDIIFY